MKLTRIDARSSAQCRAGYTLVELMASLASASIILGGLSSSLYIASQSLDQGGTAQRAEADQVLDKFVADVEHALWFSERTANAATFTVPDRDGDSLPDTIRYAWSGTPGDPLTYEYNGSAAETIAEDVHNFNLASMTRFMAAPVIPPEEGGNKLLFVVADPASLNSKESGRLALMEGWGYTVTLIDDADTQANFDTEAAANDVVYVSSMISGGSLADKLTGSTTAIVSEFPGKLDNFGFCSSTTATIISDGFALTGSLHYITEPFSGNPVTIFNSSAYAMPIPDGILSPDLENVALVAAPIVVVTPALVALDAGAQRWDGNPAPARRVHLPFGAAETTQLTADGQTLMQRAIEWAAGAGDSEGGPLLLVVSDDASPTTQEIARQTLMESWGYTVTLLDDDATTLELGTALGLNDVVYISQEITNLTVMAKLKDATIGVVNEEGQLIDDFGMASGSPTAVTLTNASITDNTHYITSPYSLGELTLSAPWQPFTYVNAGVAAGVEVLATVFNKSSLMVAETGAELLGGTPAPGRRVQLPWGSDGFNFAALNTDGQTLMRRAIEWAGTPPSDHKVLLIVGNGTTLASKDVGYKELMESWGHTVTVIDDGDSQANYDVAMAEADVVYASGSALGENMLDKATNTTKGMVSEVNGKIDNFGFSSSTSSTINTDTFSSTNASHYITEAFGGNPVTIFTSSMTNPIPGGTLAPDLQNVGEVTGTLVLGTLETDATRYDGNPSQGRRVHLPYAAAKTTDMTADGQTIMKRAIEWAAGLGGGGGGGAPNGNFGFETQFASTFQSGNGVQVGTQVTLPVNGTLNSITAYIDPRGKNFRYAIYTDNGGEPGNLVVESAVDSQSGAGWKTIDVTPTPVTAGTYWLALAFSHGQQKYYYESTGGTTRHKLHNAVNNGFISVWPGSTTPYDHKISIYGTYTPSN